MKSRLYRNVIAMTAVVMEAFGCQVAPNDRIDATLCQTDALFNVLPQTCDMWTIWPGYHKVYPSIRLAAMRDGIRDYELLRMLEVRSSSDADALCRRIVTDQYNYTADVKTFRAERKNLLELLSN